MSDIDQKSSSDDDNSSDDDETSSEDNIDSCEEEYEKDKWIHDDKPIWRLYLNSYVEKAKERRKEEKLNNQDREFPKLSENLDFEEEFNPPYECFPLNIFNIQAMVPDHVDSIQKTRIWQMMKSNLEVDMKNLEAEVIPEVKRTDSGKWPGTWPCIEQDIAGEMRQLKRLEKWKQKGLLPCQYYSENELDDSEKPYDDYASHKELGHARVPAVCVDVKKKFYVDRASGENPGLVNGDYIICEFKPVNGESRVYAQVCLRGIKGMHLIELWREREKTWKFCFYQALVALLVKTQLRYKYATSNNIDYIYDHAWMLFIHMGSLTISNKLCLNDVIVYNYKYNIEVELVHELNDVPIPKNVSEKYFESTLLKMRCMKRPELMKITEEIGWEKMSQSYELPVHEETKKIEQWFDELPNNYRNCIFRTSRFSLAFWNDGNFWYLFNPYRCDRYGLWNDKGHACIMKFCTKITLKRHLMILLLRAYAYEPSKLLKISDKQENNESMETHSESEQKLNTFSIQIFHIIYHCVKIHNVKLLQRKPLKSQVKKVWKELDECDADILTNNSEQLLKDDEMSDVTPREQSDWLENCKITWSRSPMSQKRITKEGVQVLGKSRWHQYYVEEKRKLFSLWGEIHPTGEIFAKENRGKQIYACYVVCAGMTRIMAPEYWSSKVLDTIVMCGDRYYTSSRLQSKVYASKNMSDNVFAWNRHLVRHFKISQLLFEVDILPAIHGELYTKNSLWKILQQMLSRYPFVILTCENSRLGLFKFCGAYYMMDVNSIGPPLFNYGCGVGYLMRATSFLKFMEVVVLTIGSIEQSKFAVNPVDILKIFDEESPSNKEKQSERKKKLVKKQFGTDGLKRKKQA
ncbi:uncharacterized protein, partial [Chelonus insularis]|uniref:uncharacterized protein n=1 Tax=Chelonus insularis TaxID=460826 RepID=UPI00158F2CB4